MAFGILLTLYMIGGAISALYFLRAGHSLITNLRERLEVALLAWFLWPLILIEEIYFAIRDGERNRVERLRRKCG